MEIKWLGVAGLFIKSSDDTGDILIDPYVSGDQCTHNPIELKAIREKITQNPQFDNVKYIIGTHHHYDHVNDIPYIWSRWNRDRTRPITTIIPQMSRKRWKNFVWRARVNRWSRGKQSRFVDSMITLNPTNNTIYPDFTPYFTDCTVSGNSIILGSLKVTFIRQYHSNLPMGIEHKQHIMGTYALYIEDCSDSAVTEEITATDSPVDSLVCKRFFTMGSSGIPHQTTAGERFDLKIDYADDTIKVPDEFMQAGFDPEYAVIAIKHPKAFEKTVGCFPNLKGVIPFHWDLGSLLTPTRKVGHWNKCGKKSVQEHSSVIPHGVKYILLQNMLRKQKWHNFPNL